MVEEVADGLVVAFVVGVGLLTDGAFVVGNESFYKK